MELVKIEQMLEAYFEGNTSLSEEQELRSFFRKEEIPAHLEAYRPLFKGLDTAKKETLQRTLSIPAPEKRNRFWMYSIAASFLVVLGVAGFMNSQSGLSSEEKEALAAFKQTKETMLLFSENLNKGTESMVHLKELTKGSEAIAVLNEFNESKKLILK